MGTKVTKKDELLARALVLMDCTESSAAFEAMGSAEVYKRVETRWPQYLKQARDINECQLSVEKSFCLDGDTELVPTFEEYDKEQSS